MKILIAYYSRRGENYVGGDIVNLPVGNTEVVAGIIKKLTGGEIFQVETVKRYPAGYHETTEVSRQELRQNARPELADHVANLADYDVLILGYPNWWGTMPMAVFSFLEGCDLTGKTILPICTHEGSGLGHSCSDIKRVCPGATVSRGLAILGGSVQQSEGEISAWLKATGMIE
ncbi:MAG TPA: flavodoxin [Myxococcales bacterium]|jgi:flavodoxin